MLVVQLINTGDCLISQMSESTANKFSGRTAIVTGGGTSGDGIGNGRAISVLLARGGANVVVVDRKPEAAQGTLKLITDEGREASMFAGDVTSEDDCQAMAAHAMEAFGRIDILINNVGVGSRGSVVATEPKTWDRVMKINVGSMFMASRHVIPHMTNGGAIVNVGSISSIRPRGLTAYSASKGAVNALTQAMAVDHGSEGIRVNAVLPGPVYTPMAADGMAPERREARKNASALKIEGTAWDVANAVAFLASDAARYITGQILIVDGGVSLLSPSR